LGGQGEAVMVVMAIQVGLKLSYSGSTTENHPHEYIVTINESPHP
jgi:hypothetical protein